MASQDNATFCLSEICNVLRPVKHKWSEIGIQLGIPNYKLKEFKKEDDPLTEAIDYWLKGNVEGPILSWQSLVGALESAHVAEIGLAKDIRLKYCQQKKSVAARSEGSCSKTEQNITELLPDTRLDLTFVLECNRDKICSQYANFVADLQQSIEKRVKARHLRYFLLNLPALTSPNSEHCKLLSSDELESKTTVTEIFEYISKSSADFLHYDTFAEIVERYGSEEDHELLKQYSENLREYMKKHKAMEFAKINPKLEEVNKDAKKTVFKIDINLLPLKLFEIDDLRKKFAKILNLRPSSLRFYSIEEGCVMLTFLVPVSVAKEVFSGDKKLTEKQIADFQALSVTSLNCGNFSSDFKNTNTEAPTIRRGGVGGVYAAHEPHVPLRYQIVGGLAGGLVGTGVGAVLGSILPGPGTVLGSRVGSVIGNAIGQAIGIGIGREEAASTVSTATPASTADTTSTD